MADVIQLALSDLRSMAHHVLVSRQYRLVLFTIPKVGSSDLIRLMVRIEGAQDWRGDPHYRPDRPFLRKLGLESARDILNDPSWTKAVVLRDPAERLLSAYLNKFVYTKSYAADLFRPNGRHMKFAEFLSWVLSPNADPDRPHGLHAGTDPHWRPQRLVGPIERFSSALQEIGDFTSVRAWIERVLRRVGAWDDHGASGWGSTGTCAIFETNTDRNRTGAAERMTEFYDRETLAAVYEAYAPDITWAAGLGLDLKKHAHLLSRTAKWAPPTCPLRVLEHRRGEERHPRSVPQASESSDG